MYIVPCFAKWAKSISTAPLDILRLCLLAARLWAQAQSTKMHALSLKGTDEVFSREALLKRRARCMSSVNGPSSNTPTTALPLWSGKPHWETQSCCIYMQVNMLKPTSLAGHPESNLHKYVMVRNGNPNVYYKVTDDWPPASLTEAREKRVSSLSGFHHSVHSGQWSGRCLVTQPCVNGTLLKAGGRYSWLLLRQTHGLLCGAAEVSWWGTLSQCSKHSLLSVTCTSSFWINMKAGGLTETWDRKKIDLSCHPLGGLTPQHGNH